MSGNPFIKIGDDLYAEEWNGAILMMAACNPLITITLPDDLDGGNFVIGSEDENENLIYTKAGFLLTFLTLNNTVILNNQIHLVDGETTGTATFRIYPNLMPFKYWRSLSWIVETSGNPTETVTCEIKRGSDGSIIEGNCSNPQDLSNFTMGLEPIDFIFTLTTHPVNLTSIQLAIQGGL